MSGGLPMSMIDLARGSLRLPLLDTLVAIEVTRILNARNQMPAEGSGGQFPGKHDDRICEADGVVFAASGDTESVGFGADVCLEERADAVGIPGSGKEPARSPSRSRSNFNCSLRRRTSPADAPNASNSARVRARVCEGSRRISQWLKAAWVATLGATSQRRTVPPGFATRFISRSASIGSRKWWNEKRVIDAVECVVDKRQIAGGTELPCDVFDLLFDLIAASAIEHGGNEVEAGDVACELCKEAGDDARTAGDVEHGILGPDGGAVGHQVEDGVLAVAMPLCEGLGLASELVEDGGVVLRGAHSEIMPSAATRKMGETADPSTRLPLRSA